MSVSHCCADEVTNVKLDACVKEDRTSSEIQMSESEMSRTAAKRQQSQLLRKQLDAAIGFTRVAGSHDALDAGTVAGFHNKTPFSL